MQHQGWHAILLGSALLSTLPPPTSAQERREPSRSAVATGDPAAFVATFWPGPGCEPVNAGRRGGPAIEQVFASEIATLLRRIAAKPRQEGPSGYQAILLLMAQDCYGARPRLTVQASDGVTTADVLATFQTGPGWVAAQSNLYRLVRTAAGWRVADVVQTVVDRQGRVRRETLVQQLRREAG